MAGGFTIKIWTNLKFYPKNLKNQTNNSKMKPLYIDSVIPTALNIEFYNKVVFLLLSDQAIQNQSLC